MYRFLLRPKWLGFHLLVIGMIVLMINLGLWQKHRLDERREFNAEVRARATEPIVPIEDVVIDGVDPDDVQWRTVTATGTYLADEQVIVVNRSQDGFSGVNAVTPLQLADGRLVLVNRGFVPSTFDVPAPTTGEVVVTGRLRETQERSIGGLTEGAGELREVFRIDIPRLAEQLPAEVLPVCRRRLSEPAQREPAKEEAWNGPVGILPSPQDGRPGHRETATAMLSRTSPPSAPAAARLAWRRPSAPKSSRG